MCHHAFPASKTATDRGDRPTGVAQRSTRLATSLESFGARATRLAVLAVLLGGGAWTAALAGDATAEGSVTGRARANFGREEASPIVRQTAHWVVGSRDNAGLPFAIVDKVNAKVFVFTAFGGLRGAAPALLGSAPGDDSVPGIGNKKLADIEPGERTTPAGRFVAEMGVNMRGQEILWVDYGAAVSMHRVITSNPREHRAQRLATPTPLDNRITYGCINVPEAFYLNVVHPVFSGTTGIVYVLPEIRTAQEVFHSYIAD